ncbi:condensation domain-containing protein [Sutcliffiella horikoshii]|uniref:condensation domain-containing protein n=1 Tax=Sutcliffiella horikoshii TaxID=79883 RepID=UPI001653C524|nr:condensation domain-containing protein [Sutcliffiella horikoshii]
MLEKMPLNRNGKIDRKALPEPNELERMSSGYTGPRNELEQRLVEIWEEVLEVSPIGIDDNFFDLGGHSLKAIQIRLRIKQQLGIEIDLKDLFEQQTISKLNSIIKSVFAKEIEGEKEAETALNSNKKRSIEVKNNMNLYDKNEDYFYELSNGQERLWFQSLYTKNTLGEVVVYEFNGEVDSSALFKALRSLVKRHSIMRTTIVEVDGHPFQRVHESLKVHCIYEDLSKLSKEQRFTSLASAIEHEQNHSFNLSCESFFRMNLYYVEPQKHVLLLCVNHIGCDGWSREVFMKDLFRVYQVIISGKNPSLLPAPAQYIEFTKWQKEQLIGGALEKQKDYWMGKLDESIESSNLPYDKNISLEEQNPSDVRIHEFNPEIVNLIRKVKPLYRGTTYMTVLAVIKVWLSLQNNQSIITIGSTFSGRTELRFEDLIGLCINPVALRTDLTGNPSFLQVLKRVQETTFEAYNNQDYPFDLIIQEKTRQGQNSKLYSICFIGQNSFRDEMEYDGVEVNSVPLNQFINNQNENLFCELNVDEWQEFDLLLYLIEENGKMVLEARYNSAKFLPETIDGFFAQLEHILGNLVNDPKMRLSEIELFEDKLEALFSE